MKVSRGSWHYQLIQRTDGKMHENLCPYVRSVAWAMAKAVVLLGMTGALTAGMLFLAINVFITGPLLIWQYGWAALNVGDGPASLAAVFWFFAAFIGTGIGTIQLSRKAQAVTKRIVGRVPAPKEGSTVGVIRAWLKAKHDKVCPPIDFYWGRK